MYLIYDVLQIRQSSIGHKLLVKRRNWKSTTDDIASLTSDQLQEAAKAIANKQVVDNPVIQRLQRDLVTIGKQVPQSFSEKLTMRSKINGLQVRLGMIAVWLTINPSDLRNPLVLTLAGIELPPDALPAANAAIRRAIATANPVAVAQFFHHTCKALFDGLLCSSTTEIGILGQVSNHFGVVETNGCGMLHLHALIWLAGNVAFDTLRHRLLEDDEYAARMIRYLETIIVHSIDPSNDASAETDHPNVPLSAKAQDTDEEFHTKLSTDSNIVARKAQIHSSKHNATCFKYGKNNKGEKVCRFGMPRDLVDSSKIDELGTIQLARNHGWVNPWNHAIASCIRSNHDISWVPTVTKSLSLIYYLTNYATKDDISPQQMLLKAALLKKSIEKAKTTLNPDSTDVRLLEKDIDKFELRCYNSLSQDREISGVQIASSLLQLPTYYTANDNFVQINLWWLRRYVHVAMIPIESQPELSSESLDEERCTFQSADTAPVSRFDNYKWRGPDLSDLTFFEYCMLVQTKRKEYATAFDAEFDHKHPMSATHVQRLASKHSQIMTVNFNGQLSECQSEEDRIPGGQPTTNAIRNDVAEVLLGLFVPWDKLLSLFQQYAAEYETKRDACLRVWDVVEPTISPHNRNFARNIGLLKKSREDAQLDSAIRSQDYAEHSIDDVVPDDLDLDTEECLNSLHEEYSSESLIAAYHSIATSWHREVIDVGKNIPSLFSTSNTFQPLKLQNISPINICGNPGHATSGLKFLPGIALEQWESRIKSLTVHNDVDDIETEESITEIDDFDLDLGDSVLRPTLTIEEIIPSLNLADLRSRLDIDNFSGSTLTELVIEILPLNQKQRLVVEKVLSEALAWKDHPYDASKRDQMFVFATGEGGVGKSRIVKAIGIGMDIILRKDEVILTAPTGSAADNISGNTYHSALGMTLAKKQQPSVNSRVRKLWTRKTIMFIDEISMTDLSMLSKIDRQCKIARSLDRSSPDLFGGLPVVIFMGDFFQFPPVRGPALWQNPRVRNDDDENGRAIWHRFTNVIILDEQMRQAKDPKFRDLLRRARAGTLTKEDLTLLNKKVVKSLFTPDLENATIVVKRNTLRHHINRIKMEHFARSRSQKIYIFPAEHTRVPSTSTSYLTVDDLLKQTDQGSMVPFQGLFLYTLGMPAIILANICSLLGHVNGTRGIVSGIVLDPTGMSFHLSSNI